MLVSLKEINKYVSLEGLDANMIAKGLTFSGTEVEEIRPLAQGTCLVIGEILDCVAHPEDIDPEEGIEVNTSEIMVFTKDYVETVWDEMKWEILAAEEMQKQKDNEVV